MNATDYRNNHDQRKGRATALAVKAVDELVFFFLKNGAKATSAIGDILRALA